MLLAEYHLTDRHPSSHSSASFPGSGTSAVLQSTDYMGLVRRAACMVGEREGVSFFPFYLFILVSTYVSWQEQEVPEYLTVDGSGKTRQTLGGDRNREKNNASILSLLFLLLTTTFLELELVIDMNFLQNIRIRASVVWLTMTLQAYFCTRMHHVE